MDSISVLATAFLLGAAHAFEPGHGKSAMLGALLSSKRPWRDPIALGVGTAAGHTLGVLVFAYFSFFLAHGLMDGHIRELFEMGVGTLLVAIGIAGLCMAVWSREKTRQGDCSCCGSQKSDESKHLLPGVGFLIGLIPCPTVIALALSSVGFTGHLSVLFLSVAFGLGVALALATLGVLVTHLAVRVTTLPRLQALTRIGVYIGPLSFVIVGSLLLLHTVSHRH